MLNVALVLTNDSHDDVSEVMPRTDADGDVVLNFRRTWHFTKNGDNLASTEMVSVYLTRAKAEKLAVDIANVLAAAPTEVL